MAWELAVQRGNRGRRGGGSFAEKMTASITTNKKSDYPYLCLAITIPPVLLKQARWVIGDRVLLYYNKETNLFLLKRGVTGLKIYVRGASKGANKNHMGNNDVKAMVRIRTPDFIVKEKRSVSECQRVSAEEEGIVFKMPEGFLSPDADGENA